MASKSSQQATWRAPFIIEPTSPHAQTFILLHGLGSNGEKFGRELLDIGISSSGQSLQTAFPSARFIFPTAKTRRVIALKRSRVPAWFDMYSLGDRVYREDVQIDGLIESSAYIRSIIQRELQGSLQPQHIVLGGISNGCATGLITLLSLDFHIGAFVGLCARLPFRGDIDDVVRYAGAAAEEDGEGGQVMFSEETDADPSEGKDAATLVLDFVRDLVSLDSRDVESTMAAKSPLTTPVFLGHGEKDEVIPYVLGRDAAQTLTALGIDVTWKLYPDLAHWYQIPDEIDDVLAFLRDKALPL